MTSPSLEFSTAITESRWDDACAIAVRNKDVVSHPRSLLNLTYAATQTLKPAALELCLTEALRQSLPDHIKLAIAKCFASIGRNEEALIIFSNNQADAKTSQSFAALCKVISNTSNSDCVRTASRLVVRASKSSRVSTQAGIDMTERNLLPAEPPHLPYPIELSHPKDIDPRFPNYAKAFDAKFGTTLRQMPPPPLTLVRNACVYPTGTIVTSDGKVFRAGRPDTNFLSPDASIRKVDTAFFAMIPTSGFFHWYAEWLPSLYFNSTGGGCLLIRADSGPFVEESLQLALPGSQIVRVGEPVFVERLFFRQPSFPAPKYAQFYNGGLNKIISNARSFTTQRDAKIYISRRDSQRRRMGGEDELEELLSAKGFRICLFSGMSIAEQVGVIRSARTIVLPHGAATAHLLAAERSTTVYEIVPAAIDPLEASLRMGGRKITLISGIKHVMRIERWNPVTDAWKITPRVVADDIEART